ncbi:MAG TPA: hypothetical protein VGI39_30200 [Polyangiaceae bacterium]
MPKTSQVTKAARAEAILKGVEKRLVAMKSVSIDGKARSINQVRSIYRAYLDSLEEVRRARNVLEVAIDRERAAAARMDAFTPMLRWAVEVYLGKKHEVLGDFGWVAPKKPGPKTIAAKRAGVVKREAAREAKKRRG